MNYCPVKKQNERSSSFLCAVVLQSLHRHISHWLRENFFLVSEATLVCEIHKKSLQNLWVHAQLVWANILQNTHHFYAQEIKTGRRETITLAFKKSECLTWNLQYLISAWNYTTERFDGVRQKDVNQYRWARLPYHARWLKSKIQTPDTFPFFLSFSSWYTGLTCKMGNWREVLWRVSQHGRIILPFFFFLEFLAFLSSSISPGQRGIRFCTY